MAPQDPFIGEALGRRHSDKVFLEGGDGVYAKKPGEGRNGSKRQAEHWQQHRLEMFANSISNWYVPKWVHQIEFYANKKRKCQTDCKVWNGCQTEEEVADVAVGAGVGAVGQQDAKRN